MVRVLWSRSSVWLWAADGGGGGSTHWSGVDRINVTGAPSPHPLAVDPTRGHEGWVSQPPNRRRLPPTAIGCHPAGRRPTTPVPKGGKATSGSSRTAPRRALGAHDTAWPHAYLVHPSCTPKRRSPPTLTPLFAWWNHPNPRGSDMESTLLLGTAALSPVLKRGNTCAALVQPTPGFIRHASSFTKRPRKWSSMA